MAVIKARVSPREYETWFAPTRFVGAESDVAVIRVPNAIFVNHLEGEYRDRILSAFEATGSPMTSVRCQVAGHSPWADDGAHEMSPAAPRIPPPQGADPGERASRSDPLTPAYSFDSFVVGPSNRCAHSAALDVSASAVEYSPYNPLLIYGAEGLGKTHLLHATARRFLEKNPSGRILHLRGEVFSGRVVNAVRDKDLHGFREECARLDMLLLDNIQFIPGLDRFGRSAAEFFHALTALAARGRQIVLTSDSHPREIQNLDPRIKSRLEGGLTANIDQPDWQMRATIVRHQAAALGVELPDGVPETLASRFQNNGRELEGPLKSLVAKSRSEGVAISAPLVDRVLAAHPANRPRRPSIQEVQIAVATAFGVAPLRLTAAQRSKTLVLARHVAMYLCRETTGRTLKEIGKGFRRDHSTVTYGIRRIAAQRERDLGLDRILERLLRQLS